MTNTSAVSRDDAVTLGVAARRADPGRALPVGVVGLGGLDAPRLPAVSRCTCWPPRTPAREFAGQRLLSHEEARAAGAAAAAVIVGDSPEEATYDNLNVAFRLVRAGARLVGMHRNPWWLTPDGPTLDSGAYVVGLEFAAGTRATIIGKPSPAFFSAGVADLRREAGRDLARGDIAMVGDDVRTDIRAAQRAGLRGIFVLSGKHGPADVEAAAAERGGRRPHAVAPSLADVVAALD